MKTTDVPVTRTMVRLPDNKQPPGMVASKGGRMPSMGDAQAAAGEGFAKSCCGAGDAYDPVMPQNSTGA